jgi:hypothetical protein
VSRSTRDRACAVLALLLRPSLRDQGRSCGRPPAVAIPAPATCPCGRYSGRQPRAAECPKLGHLRSVPGLSSRPAASKSSLPSVPWPCRRSLNRCKGGGPVVPANGPRPPLRDPFVRRARDRGRATRHHSRGGNFGVPGASGATRPPGRGPWRGSRDGRAGPRPRRPAG